MQRSLRDRLRKFIEEWAFIIWLLAALVGLGWVAFRPYPPVIAAPAAKYQPPGCTQFGIVGTVIIVRCIDDDGNILFANSAGYMMPAGN